MDEPPHRKQNQHFDEPGHLHFLTFSCYKRLPLLTNDLFRTWFARALDDAGHKHDMDLVGYVFMPEHVHPLVWPKSDAYSIADYQHSLKRPFSRRVKEHLEQIKSPLIEKLTVQDRPGVQVFRFWQAGGWHYLNVWSEKYIRKSIEYMHNNPVTRRLVKTPDRWRWSSFMRWQFPDGTMDPDLPDVKLFEF